MSKSLLEQLTESVPGASPDFRTELAAQLAAVVPEAVADGKLRSMVEAARRLRASFAARS